MGILSPPTLRASRVRWIACGLVVAALFALFGSESAVAESCGHYVKRLGPGFVPGKAAAEKVAAETAAHQASVPCGCKGPECRRAPADPTPLVPGAPLRIPAPREMTLLAGGDFAIRLSGDWLTVDPSARPLSGYPLRLNRPPALAL
jgi:hypothetical protein